MILEFSTLKQLLAQQKVARVDQCDFILAPMIICIENLPTNDFIQRIRFGT